MAALGNGIRAHPLREELVQELHARPYAPLSAPERGSHVAVLMEESASTAPADHLADLCRRYGAPVPGPGAKFYSQDLGPFRIRWEQHTEFFTYTFVRRGIFREPFTSPTLDLVPADWLAAMPGEALAAVHFALEARTASDHTPEELALLFGGNPVFGARVAGGAARAWTDLRTHDDGFSRLLIRDQSLSKLQGGRLVQRLLEINAYRLLSLLSLPLARDASPELHRMDRQLGDIAGRLAGAESGIERSLLEELSALAAELERMIALTSYRFSATRAYFDIVQARLRDIREQRIQGLQTFSEFLDRRLVPAVNYCYSTRDRLQQVSERMSRMGSLLRARVEVQIEEQNRDLLASMDRRAKQQFRLQRLVEGLSVVAVTYYLMGLVMYAVHGIAAAGVTMDTALVAGAALPAVLALAWMALRRARRAVETEA